MEIKNLEKAAKRIKKAIQAQENIILYGDSDLDGTSSIIILKETIETLGGKITIIYFPDREKEGYGISKKALDSLKNLAPALFIALDCGIGNFEEIELAQKLGFDVIVIDHHEILDKIPNAEIVVDPKQPDDFSNFKELATVGLVFKLSEVLLKDKMSRLLRNNFLELVAIATIADMMPQTNENRFLIKEGLTSLPESWRPGLKAFLEDKILQNLTLNQKVSKIISFLNVRDIENKMPASFRLLTADSINKAQTIILQLKEKLKERKEKIKLITEQIKERISEGDKIIFEGDENFDLTLLSAVASFFCQKLRKPIFLFKKMEKESHGTVRTPDFLNSVELMKKCRQYLISFGGHPQASGFRIKNEDLEKFKECLLKNYEKNNNSH